MKDDLNSLNEMDGPVFKMRRDPRIIRFGVFLRRFSMDELPQLFNVLKGDLSLVGPRPATLDEVAQYNSIQLQRLAIRPGLVGLPQIRGRSDLTFQRLVKWDLWYIDNWSMGLDWRILVNTIPSVLKGEGAYHKESGREDWKAMFKPDRIWAFKAGRSANPGCEN